MKKIRPSKRIVDQKELKKYEVKSNQRLIDFLIETFPNKSRNNIKTLLKKNIKQQLS